MDNKELAKTIVEYVGGIDNIAKIGHCATRLRVTLHDDSKFEKEKIQELPDVAGISKAGAQKQIILGPNVRNVYNEIAGNLSLKNDEVKEKAGDERIIDKCFSYITGVISPVFTGFIACGIIKTVCTLLTMGNLVSADSALYLLLSAAGASVFDFMPIIVAYGAAKHLKSNPVIAILIAVTFYSGTYTGLISTSSLPSMFLVNYQGTFMPILLAMPVVALIERKLNKYIPQILAGVFVPAFTILLSIALIFFVIGPLGQIVSQIMYEIFNFVNSISPILAGAFIGGTIGYMVITGTHLAIIPLMLNNIAVYGFDYIVCYSSIHIWVEIAIVLAFLVCMKSKEKQSDAVAALITGFVGGVTEPLIFGYVIQHKFSLILNGVCGAIGGALIGLLQISQVNMMGGVTSFFVNFATTELVLKYLCVAVVTMVLAFMLTFIYIRKNQVNVG